MEKLKHLEGLRGLAALLVFFHHIRLLFYKDAFSNLDISIKNSIPSSFLQNFCLEFKNTFGDGTLFVWVFWILSSYVLSIQFFRKSENQSLVLFKSFVKRYFRLFIPVTASVLLVIIFMKSSLFFNQEASKFVSISSSEWLASFFNFPFDFPKVLSFIFSDVYFHSDLPFSFNPVLWSIQNEFIGSLFIFALFGIVKQHKFRFFVYFLLGFFLIYLNFFLLIPFLLGYVMCDLDFSLKHHSFFEKVKEFETSAFKYKWLSFTLLLFLLIEVKVVLLHFKTENHTIYITQSFIILYFALRNPLFRTFLSLKWMYKFGTISFSFYLLHMLVICSFTSYLITINQSSNFKILLVFATLIVSILISIPFYLFIDKFAIQKSRKLANFFAEKENS